MAGIASDLRSSLVPVQRRIFQHVSLSLLQERGRISACGEAQPDFTTSGVSDGGKSSAARQGVYLGKIQATDEGAALVASSPLLAMTIQGVDRLITHKPRGRSFLK